MKSLNKCVFISSDCLNIKRQFKELYGETVRYIDEEPVYIVGENKLDPKSTFMDFFLLAKCPVVFVTGGTDDPELPNYSTFGYSSAAYGKAQLYEVFN